MVLNERNNENNVRNGKRSRGPSPNGHGGSPDSSSDDDCKCYILIFELYSDDQSR